MATPGEGGGGDGGKKKHTHTKKTQKGPASMAYATEGYGSVDVATAKESDGIRASVSVLGAWTRRQAPHPGWTQANEAPGAGS